MKGGRGQSVWERGDGNPERERLKQPVPRLIQLYPSGRDKQVSLSPKPHFLIVHSSLSCSQARGPSATRVRS